MLARTLRCTLATLALLTPLFAQERMLSDEQKAEAVKEFKKQWGSYKDASQQQEAIFTLKAAESPEAATELVRLFDHKTPEVRNAAVTILGMYRNEATFKPYLDEIAALKPVQHRSQLIEVFGKAKLTAALPVFKLILEKDKKCDVATRYEIARAIGAIGDPSAKDEVALLLGDPDPNVRIVAADVVGKLAIKGLGPQLVPLFQDAAWQVQVSAVQAAAKVRPQEAVDPLIELMRKGGRLKEETAEALFRITALDFGADADAWAMQMKRLKEVGWRIPTDEELKKAAEARQKNDAFYGRKPGEKTTFAGITTTSTNVLFIIDVSGSMEELVIEKAKFQSGYTDFSKFTIVRTELLRTLDGLKDNTYFNIISFATDLDPWKKVLVQANMVNKDGAKQWVKHLKPLGGVESQELASVGLGGSGNVGAGKTNTYKALMSIFAYDPDKQAAPPAPTTGGAARFSKDSKLDTVFFLSDGRPSTGKYVDMEEIRREVRQMNELYKVVIHTIAIGEFQKDFMKGIASDNGGVFVDLGK